MEQLSLNLAPGHVSKTLVKTYYAVGSCTPLIYGWTFVVKQINMAVMTNQHPSSCQLTTQLACFEGRRELLPVLLLAALNQLCRQTDGLLNRPFIQCR